MHSLPSKLFWAPSPSFIRTMKLVHNPLIKPLLTNPPAENSQSREKDPGPLLTHRRTGDGLQNTYG